MPQPSFNVLIVDDEINIRKTLSLCLESEGHRVVSVSNFEDALSEASRRFFELAFVDLRLGSNDGLDLIPALLSQNPGLKILVITAYASIESAVEAMRRGAADYLPKPFTPPQVILAVRRLSELRSLEQKVAGLEEDLGRWHPEISFSSNSASMERAVNLARQVASSGATVLLRGESGTGKTLLARAIHSWSNRSQMAFAAVSCPSLSSELIESELFGHVKGAFTGALRDNPGRIAACQGGSLLLDEIGDLPLSVQPKLLRFLQDREYERVGDYQTRKADVRFLTATNVDLEQGVREGRFREDLFYRLNVITILIPPLRERTEDIVPMAERLLAFFARQGHRTFTGFTEEARSILREYPWPGNVRELRNVVERAAILCRSNRIGPDCFPENLAPLKADPKIGDPIPLEQLEEIHIRRILASSKSLQEAAEILGMDQATLWRKRKKYGI